MPSPTVRAQLLLLLLSAALPLPAAAQRHLPASVDLSIGAGPGTGGTFSDDAVGVSLDLLVGARLRSTPGGALIAAVSTGVYGPLVTSETCVVAPGGGCLPSFPLLASVGVLGGVQRGSPSGPAVRFLAGAAYLRSDERVDAGAVQARIDVDTPPFLHTSAVLSVRSLVLPGYRGETIAFTAVGVGLRVR